MYRPFYLIISTFLAFSLAGCSLISNQSTPVSDDTLISEITEKETFSLKKGDTNAVYATISPISKDTVQFKQLIQEIETRALKNQKTHISKTLKEALLKMSSEIKMLSDELNTDVKGDTVLVTIPGHLTFAEGSNTIRAQSFKIMASVADYTQKNEVELTVYGYSYMENNINKNKTMSYERAELVRLFFINQGFNEQKINAIGKANSNPISTIKDFMGRQKNRRVEITIKLTSEPIQSLNHKAKHD
jgi:flagellar motor protein MotB